MIVVGVFQSGIQPVVVERSESDQVKFVRRAEFRGQFELVVVIGRQEGQAEYAEQHLQVAATIGGQQRGLAVSRNRRIEVDPEIRRSEDQFAFEPRRVAVAHPHVHHRTEAVAERGRERPGVEVDRTQQVGVDQRGVAARSALHGEVVQHRDFDAVEVIFVFVGPAAAYEHVVALDGRGDDPGG